MGQRQMTPTKSRSQEWSRDEQSCCHSALCLAEHVGNDCASVGHRGRSKRTRKEAQDQQGRDVGSARRRHTERRVRRVRDHVDRLAPVYLRQGCPDQRSQGETQHVERQAQSGHLCGDIESLHDALDPAGVHRAGERQGERGQGLENGNGPFPPLGEIHRILPVVVEVVNNVWILVCAVTGVVLVPDIVIETRMENERSDPGHVSVWSVELLLDGAFGVSGFEMGSHDESSSSEW